MGNKTPPYSNYPAWTEARFWAFIRSALRSAWGRYPPKFEALKKVERPYKGTDKRRKKEWQCAECKQYHMQKNVTVDHIVPAGQLRCYADLPGFVERLFVSVDDLQVLCKPCHLAKTAEERKERDAQRKEDN